MNAQEFASRLLDLVASAVPDNVKITKGLANEIDSLIEEFSAPPEPVLKFDDERRLVYGWASVISKNGTPIIDRQGDVLNSDDLREAVHDFMKHRTAGDMHGELGIGEVVESFVLDANVQKSLGIDLGMEGWYVGVHVPNDAVWDKVRKGEYKAFSIGGTAVREAISDEVSKDYMVVKSMKAINDGTPSDESCPNCGKKHAKGKCLKKSYKKCKDCGKNEKTCGCSDMKKFNQNHGADGKFSSGGGGGKKVTPKANPNRPKNPKAQVDAKVGGHKNMLSLTRAVASGKVTTAHHKNAKEIGIKHGAKTASKIKSEADLNKEVNYYHREMMRADNQAYRARKEGDHEMANEHDLYGSYYGGIYDGLTGYKTPAKTVKPKPNKNPKTQIGVKVWTKKAEQEKCQSCGKDSKHCKCDE